MAHGCAHGSRRGAGMARSGKRRMVGTGLAGQSGARGAGWGVAAAHQGRHRAMRTSGAATYQRRTAHLPA
eukprot:scaffold68532_cov70-Phaeocystis_antarctica.AAC.3